MSTPSEVIAGVTLSKSLGFKKVKFIDKTIDYTAMKDGNSAVIEVKDASTLRLNQMKELAQELANGKQVFLHVTTKDGQYCLFQLVNSNLAQQPLKINQEKGKKKRIYNFGGSHGVFISKEAMEELGLKTADEMVELIDEVGGQLIFKPIQIHY